MIGTPTAFRVSAQWGSDRAEARHHHPICGENGGVGLGRIAMERGLRGFVAEFLQANSAMLDLAKRSRSRRRRAPTKSPCYSRKLSVRCPCTGMSAFGTKRTPPSMLGMSALRGKADIPDQDRKSVV